jgi:hypothetical protein
MTLVSLVSKDEATSKLKYFALKKNRLPAFKSRQILSYFAYAARDTDLIPIQVRLQCVLSKSNEIYHQRSLSEIVTVML